MIHYSCDRCRKEIDLENEIRYVVRLEAEACMDQALTEIEEDRDHLMELSEILERAADLEDDSIGDEIYQKKRFDLCSCCYRKFVADPLGMAVTAPPQLNFSEN